MASGVAYFMVLKSVGDRLKPPAAGMSSATWLGSIRIFGSVCGLETEEHPVVCRRVCLVGD